MSQKSQRELNALGDYVEVVDSLHQNWTPHIGQIKIGRALFKHDRKQIFAKCGRNFGKTDLICYALWRYAKTHPGSENYYFAPLAKQAKEIIWASDRLQSFGPRGWLLDGSRGVNNSETRLRFRNGSFIKLDGTDNIDSYRGVKPRGLSVYDEYKDFRPRFHEAMDPNFAAFDSPLLVVGTPPEVEAHHFYELESEFKANPDKSHFEFASTVNPHISPTWFERKKAELYAKGEGDVWEREYMVQRVFGGKRAIFPMLKRDIIKPHDQLMKMIERDKKKLTWGVVADPGTVTCFGVLYGAMNPYTRQLYLIDEIYEEEQAKTSVDSIGRRILQKEQEHYARAEWYRSADEAAAWFINEMTDRFDAVFMPTQKSLNKKEDGIGLIKDLLLNGKIIMSDRCKNLFFEMSNYIKTDQGKIPKEYDHLIDCLRYMLAMFGYSLNETLEPVDREIQQKETKRYYTPDEDLRADGLIEDDLEFDPLDY